MKNNLNWSPQEDCELGNLVFQSKGKFCWSMIAQMLNQKFKNKTRFGKQCRERFLNHIKQNNDNIIISQWTQEQTATLFANYLQLGSKWTQISKRLSTKTENCVKNKFYGTLRKKVRSLNVLLKTFCRKNKKQIKLKSILRILLYAEGHFRLQTHLYQSSIQIRKKLMQLVRNQQVNMNVDQLKALVDKINDFSRATRSYKYVKKNQIQQKLLLKQDIQVQSQVQNQQKQQSNEKMSTEDNENTDGIQRIGSQNKQNLIRNQQILLKQCFQAKQIQPFQQNPQKVELKNFLNYQENKSWQNHFYQNFFGNIDQGYKQYDQFLF